MSRPDDARHAAGREALRAAGVGDDETAPAPLLALAGRAPDLDLAIAERLGRVPSDDRARALRDLATAAEQRGWKAAAKEARRALYRFGQRGIEIPPAPAPAPVAPRAQASTLEGYLSPIDGRGDRLVWLTRPQREGGLIVMTAVLNEPRGLRDVAIAELARKTLRRMERDLAEQHHLRMVPADAAYCDALLAEGFARARAAETAGVGEYPAYRTRLVAADPAPLEPPLIVRVADAAALAAAEPGARAVALLDEIEFATWTLERATLAPYLAAIAAVRESPLVLSRPQQEERARAVVVRALHEIFGGAGATTYRRRLEEMAYYLHAAGRRDLALAAAATARAIAESPRGGEGVAFCEALVQRSFELLLAEDAARARAEAEGSVLVRPGAPAVPPRRPIGG